MNMESKTYNAVKFDEWKTRKKILVILAHPDDPEFFLGGTIAQWTGAGHEVSYLLFTKGERGISEKYQNGEELKLIRVAEQKNAASVLGVTDISYLDFPDGYIEVNLENRRMLVGEIRKRQPDLVVSCDPQTLFHHYYVNHPDHRAVGMLSVDAVFPAAGSPAFFPEQLEEGLRVAAIQELWLSLTVEPNISLDVSPQWDLRIKALKKHVSQIGDPIQFEQKWNERRREAMGSEDGYQEHFRRVVLRIP